jgi:DNA helicase IV
MPHPDLAAEQAHIDHAYERLDAMRAGALDRLKDAFGQGRGGTHHDRNDRDVIVRTSLSRLQQLELGQESLVFGRIDEEGGETFHIGRLAVSDDDQEPLVVDWRAPVAEPFYRATGRHAMGLARRRHFLTNARMLLDMEDELFGPGAGEGLGLGLAGSTVLMAALDRSRSGRMRDIVATVQREQDEIIRAPLPGVLVVQGGPGTGKTAVALHRAAYLLYTDRFPLERQGVLVVGPNPLYLRYIEHVLPSLGETGVELFSIGGLVADTRSTGVESPQAARIKGDVRMARLLSRAVSDRQRALPNDVDIPFGPHLLRLSSETSAAIVAAVKRRPGLHNGRSRQVEALVYRHLHQQYLQADERAARVGLRPRESAEDWDGDETLPDNEPLSPEELRRQLRHQPELVAAIDRMWPRLSPHQLLHDLFGAPALLALAARGSFTAAELDWLARPRSAFVAEVAWTPADLPLIDEVRAVLGPLRTRTARGGDGQEVDEGLRSYGHIVVDEAQDLSPMQLRMLARRSLSGSMTVVGDIAQATGQWAPDGWDQVLAHLPTRRGASVFELSVNYRTPSEIMEVAGRVLQEAIPGLPPPESVRSVGYGPVLMESPVDQVPATAARAAAEALGAVGDGSVAVIAPASLLPDIGSALAGGGLSYGEGNQRGLDSPITLLAVEMAKGLEFDAVVVVEPSRMLRETAQGLRALYVALTRATKRLTVVAGEPLPRSMHLEPALTDEPV